MEWNGEGRYVHKTNQEITNERLSNAEKEIKALKEKMQKLEKIIQQFESNQVSL